jgi:hypothetical protein
MHNNSAFVANAYYVAAGSVGSDCLRREAPRAAMSAPSSPSAQIGNVGTETFCVATGASAKLKMTVQLALIGAVV